MGGRQRTAGAAGAGAVLAFLFSIALVPVGAPVAGPVGNRPLEVHADARGGEIARRSIEMTGNVFEAVARLAGPAVVYIEATPATTPATTPPATQRRPPTPPPPGSPQGEESQVEEESGSGVLVRPEGLGRPVVVTNLHVVGESGPADIEVHLASGIVLSPVRVWGDEETDLAVLDLGAGAADLPAVRMGNSDELRIGQWVIAIGSPFGLAQSVTHGIISAQHRRQIGISGKLRIKEFLQTDAAINPGSSGGPLLNLDGEVIGINTAIASRTGSSSGVAFSIPINLVRWVVDSLIKEGRVRRGFLGVEFPQRFTYERARRLGLASQRGALVSVVHPGTPAARAGIEVGDVILEFGGVPIDDESHLINAVSQAAVGQAIPIVVWREGRRVSLRAELVSWDDYRAIPSSDAIEKPASR